MGAPIDNLKITGMSLQLLIVLGLSLKILLKLFKRGGKKGAIMMTNNFENMFCFLIGK